MQSDNKSYRIDMEDRNCLKVDAYDEQQTKMEENYNEVVFEETKLDIDTTNTNASV